MLQSEYSGPSEHMKKNAIILVLMGMQIKNHQEMSSHPNYNGYHK